MPEMKYNLLTEPLLGVRLVAGERRMVSLPEILSLLEEEIIEAFTALQPHQKHAWHAFLVQVAAMALHRANRWLPVREASDWAALLRALTDHRDEAWCLIVDDLTRPAFLQPPVPEKSLREFKNESASPDEFDILVTAKNHDIKASRCRHPKVEHWLLSILNLQTMQGFLGAGNYGIARMNGGFSSRPGITYVPDLGFGSRFKRDLSLLLSKREEITEARYAHIGGKALLWLDPWDGESSLPLSECDPFFIEICRRVRLIERENTIIGLMRSTKAARVAAKELTGNTGDPWTPVDQDGKALTMPHSGFSYRRTQELLCNSTFFPGITQRIYDDDPPEMMFLGWALVRGQGKTEGLHQKYLRIPGHVRRTLMTATGKARLGTLAQRRVDCVADVQKKILKTALLALLQGGDHKLNFKDDRPQRWLNRHDAAIDEVFFDHLWADLDHPDAGEADRKWQRLVLNTAREQLNDAMQSCPLPDARRYRAFASAEGLFAGLARKHFPEFQPSQENAHDGPPTT
jgi:CRISPR system Cascade subunit CasA